MAKNKNKIVLFMGGGAMSGVFGSGILSSLEELDFYNNIEAVHAVSAGVLNAAYFLTRTARFGSSIYWEDLPNRFLHPWRIPYASWQRYKHRYITPLPFEQIQNVVDIDYLMEVVTKIKPLAFNKLNSLDIPFYIRVLNADTGAIEHFSPKDFSDPLSLIKAAVSIVPYFFHVPTINGFHYIDGSIYNPIGLKYLKEKHPDSKIVIALNIPRERQIKNYLHNFLEGIVAHPMHKAPLFRYFMARENKIREEMKAAENTPNVILITPPKESKTTVFTNDKETLLETYAMGKKAGLELARLF